jgi:hypothetical protein
MQNSDITSHPTIHRLNQASELGEAVFPPAMIRKAIQNHI